MENVGIMNTPNQMFAPSKVDALAAHLNKDDPDWKYVVRHDPAGTGYSVIEIYDEDGEFVSLM